MRAVNLVPKDSPRRTGPAVPPAVAATVIGGLVLVSLMISVLLLSAHGKVKPRQLELAQKQAELAAIPVPAQNRLQQQDALVADKAARVTALNAALSKRIAWDRVLREFALVLPDDVWLLSLSATAPSSATATATSTPTSTSSTPTQGGEPYDRDRRAGQADHRSARSACEGEERAEGSRRGSLPADEGDAGPAGRGRHRSRADERRSAERHQLRVDRAFGVHTAGRVPGGTDHRHLRRQLLPTHRFSLPVAQPR